MPSRHVYSQNVVHFPAGAVDPPRLEVVPRCSCGWQGKQAPSHLLAYRRWRAHRKAVLKNHPTGESA